MKISKIQTKDLTHLVGESRALCISIHLRVNRLEGEGMLEARYRTLVSQVETLIEKEHGKEKYSQCIQLLNAYKPRSGSQGLLSLFLSIDSAMEHFSIMDSEDIAVVSNSYHLKPLLELIQEQDKHYVLSVTSTWAELFKADHESLIRTWEMRNPNPRSLMGDLQFYNQVSRQLSRLNEINGSPVFLRASRRDNILFRLSNFGVTLSNENLIWNGMPEGLSKLRRSAKRLMSLEKESRTSQLVDQLYFEGTLDQTTSDISQIISEIRKGRIKSLYIASNRILWGKIDWNKRDAHLTMEQVDTKDDDILDDLAEETLKQGVPVFLVPIEKMPYRNEVIATYTSDQSTPQEEAIRRAKNLMARESAFSGRAILG